MPLSREEQQQQRKAAEQDLQMNESLYEAFRKTLEISHMLHVQFELDSYSNTITGFRLPRSGKTIPLLLAVRFPAILLDMEDSMPQDSPPKRIRVKLEFTRHSPFEQETYPEVTCEPPQETCSNAENEELTRKVAELEQKLKDERTYCNNLEQKMLQANDELMILRSKSARYIQKASDALLRRSTQQLIPSTSEPIPFSPLPSPPITPRGGDFAMDMSVGLPSSTAPLSARSENASLELAIESLTRALEVDRMMSLIHQVQQNPQQQPQQQQQNPSSSPPMSPRGGATQSITSARSKLGLTLSIPTRELTIPPNSSVPPNPPIIIPQQPQKKPHSHIPVVEEPEVKPSQYYWIDIDELKKNPELWQGFEEPDTENVITFTIDKVLKNKREVKGATLDKLVQRLTHQTEFDNDFLFAFMLTYRSFTTPDELLTKLTYRYNTLPYSDQDEILGNPEKFSHWVKSFLEPVRLRITQVLKTWMESHYYDFADDKAIQAKLLVFLNNISHTRMELQGGRLKNYLDKRIKMQKIGGDNSVIVHLTPMMNGLAQFGDEEAPKPRMPRGKLLVLKPEDLSLCHWPAIELARQLTLIEYDFFVKIHPKECLNQNWNSANQRDRAPNIYAMIQRTNTLGTWVADEICQCDSKTDRVHRIKKFIKVAQICSQLGNINGVVGIMGGLNSNAVHRLKKTWESVPHQSTVVFRQLSQLVDPSNSYRAARNAILELSPPCVPYIGMYLTDLTFIEDGNKDFHKNGLINFSKRRLLATVIREIQMYQQKPYHLQEVPALKSRLLAVGKERTMDEVYKISMQREPSVLLVRMDSAPTIVKDELRRKSMRVPSKGE